MSLWKTIRHWLTDDSNSVELSASDKRPRPSLCPIVLKVEILEDRLPPGGMGLDELLTMGQDQTNDQALMGDWYPDSSESDPMSGEHLGAEELAPSLPPDETVITFTEPSLDLETSDPAPLSGTSQVEDKSDEEAALFNPDILNPQEDPFADLGEDPADHQNPAPDAPDADPGGGGTTGSGGGSSALQVSITGISEDRGVSSTDYLTNDTTLTIQGTADPGSMVTVRGVPTETDANGKWSVAIPEEFSWEGQEIVFAEAFNPENQAFGSASIFVTIDQTPPEVRLDAPTYTLNDTPTVQVQAQSIDENGMQTTAFIDVDLNQDGKFAGSAEVGHSSGTLNNVGQGSVTLNELGAGKYQIRARVLDNAGNAGVSDSHTLEVSDDPAARLPLHFEENVGQTNKKVQFLSRGHDYGLFLTETGMTLNVVREVTPEQLEQLVPGASESPYLDSNAESYEISDSVRIEFIGANTILSENVVGLDLLAGKSNYIIGNDTNDHFSNINNYSQVLVRNVYEGVDVLYQGDEGSLRYDFVVNPGANPSQIGVGFDGVEELSINGNGDLVLKMKTGTMIQTKPVIYQVTATGARESVTGSYVLEGDAVSFAIGEYDTSRALIIDPTFAYSTLLGGTENELGRSLDVDDDGNAYVTGRTASVNFPALAGSFQVTSGGSFDVFVTKFNSNGSARVYSTYVGGTANDAAFDIAVGNGVAYVGGRTGSANFPIPTTASTSANTFGGGDDGFLFALNPNGTDLIFSTFVGGSQLDAVLGVTVDPGGIAYTTGSTRSPDFTPAPGAADTTFEGDREAFVIAYDTNLEGTNAPVYFTYLGGDAAEAGRDIVLLNGEPYVVGDTNSTNFDTTNGFQTTLEGTRDVFVTRLNSTGTAILYSTYLGGSQIENGQGITVDNQGNVYVTGETESSTNFDTRNAFQGSFNGGLGDAFISRFDTNLAGDASLISSSYLGGGFEDQGYGVDLDSDGLVYLTGRTVSADFPTNDPSATGGTNGDVYLTVFQPELDDLFFSTVFGGTLGDEGREVVVTPVGDVYVGGFTRSPDFPRVNATQATLAGGIDAFVAKVPVNALRPDPGVLADDAFEANDTSDKASLIGTISAEKVMEDLTINVKSTGFDFDWYRLTAGASGSLNVVLEETTTGNLELHLFALNGGSMVELGVASGDGFTHSLSGSVTAGQEYFVHVKGVNVSPGQLSTGAYTLTMSVS